LLGVQYAPRRSHIEFALLTMGLLAVSIPVFGWEQPSPGYVPALLLAPLPFLLWAAVRLGVGGLSLSLLILAAVALANALVGRGPFVIQSPEVHPLQIFLIAIAIPLMLLAALVQERQRAEESLKLSEARMGVAAASTDTGLWQYDVPTGNLWATEHCRSMFGLDANSLLQPQAFLAAVHPDDRAVATAAMQAVASAGETERRIEFRVPHPSGELRWYLATAHTDFDERGVPIRVSGIFRDVTQRRRAEEEAERLSERLSTIQDEERQQIAQDLHDSTAQHLVAASLNAMSLQHRFAGEPAARELCNEIGYCLDEATKELRTFTYLLHPPRLESDGLRATLQRYVDGFGRRTELKTSLRTCCGADQLPLPLQRSMLRIVQEALTNVHRHAAATRVSVCVRRIGGRTHLVISDDGQGFETTSGRHSGRPLRVGVGVPGMTARVQQFGGRLNIRSGPKGTTVHAAMPVG
jgi:PAS domain S-box-containing protein